MSKQRTLFDDLDEDILVTYQDKLSKAETIKDKDLFQKEINLLINESNNLILENILKFRNGSIDSYTFNNLVKITVAIKNNIDNYNSINHGQTVDNDNVTNIIVNPVRPSQ